MLQSTTARVSSLPVAVSLARPENPSRRLDSGDPAIALMTDFRREAPSVVAPDLQIDDALRGMILAGVRALVVVDQGQSVLGLITASDILGPKPVQFLQSPLCDGSPCRHQDVHVGDIMTSWGELQLLALSWVEGVKCADVAARFAATEATHLLVIEDAGGAASVVRGLISRTRLMRQLVLS